MTHTSVAEKLIENAGEKNKRNAGERQSGLLLLFPSLSEVEAPGHLNFLISYLFIFFHFKLLNIKLELCLSKQKHQPDNILSGFSSEVCCK